jgi:hypothetical protein
MAVVLSLATCSEMEGDGRQFKGYRKLLSGTEEISTEAVDIFVD